jgi:hypothetical protein
VCDPPYELGFMNKGWDASGIAFDPAFWAVIFRALKPGGHLLAFGGTRTYHRMACAIEDAGFEIRDSLHWVYGSGFPKSLNVSKAIDDRAGAERPIIGEHKTQLPGGNTFAQDAWSQSQRAGGQTCVYLKAGQPCQGHDSGFSQGKTFHTGVTASATEDAKRWEGWGTALKPAHEPIVLARKPFKGTVAANLLAHGTGAINVDGCRVSTEGETFRAPQSDPGNRDGTQMFGFDEYSARERFQAAQRASTERLAERGRWPANFVLSHLEECDWERDDRESGSRDYVCAPGCPVVELDRQSGRGKSPPAGKPVRRFGARASEGWGLSSYSEGRAYGDEGGASRFFYCAKPSARERDYGCEGLPVRSGGEATDREDGSAGLNSPRAGAGRRGGRRNVHPTVKPIQLMRWLCRLVTPPGGVVLDPFTGSGTTGIAALREGFAFIGVEQSSEYIEIARARIARALEETCAKEPK